MMFASLLMIEPPKSVLIIGLGGGTMSNTIHHLYPDAIIDNVEIDPAVVKVARKYFDFIENDKISTIEADGRIFIKRAALRKQSYDWIILDAFNGDYIPEHLLTKEFLEETKALLSENGVVAANTFSSSALYDYESATYYDVFGDYYQVQTQRRSNRIILATKSGQVDSELITKRAEAVDASLKDYGIDIYELINAMSSTKTIKIGLKIRVF